MRQIFNEKVEFEGQPKVEHQNPSYRPGGSKKEASYNINIRHLVQNKQDRTASNYNSNLFSWITDLQ